MRIVIDGRLWSESGIGRYIRNLVEELQNIDQNNQYFILLLKKDYDTLVYHSDNFHKVLANFKWYGFTEQIKLLQLLNGLKPDLVHFPHFNIPVLYKGKFVVTIHDLIHQHFQTRNATTRNLLIYSLKKIGYQKVFSAALKKSEKIICPSQFVKNQLIKEWKIVESKMEVTHEGVENKILKLSQKKHQQNFTKNPYLFYVGNAQPHKNISSLIKAFIDIKQDFPDLELVLSGSNHKFWENIKKEISNPRGLIFTGFVSEEQLVALYQNAQAFVMPSKEEGFGIPVLEAMACRCPVISSFAGSLHEIGKDAALYFDPNDISDMKEKITFVLKDEKFRKGLIEKGERRYKEFSWKKMAEQTLKLYNSA